MIAALKKLFIFEATRKYGFGFGSRWVYNEALLLLLNTDTLEQIGIFVTLTKNV